MKSLEPTSFTYASGGTVRAVATDDGPHFVLADVCGVLDIRNPRTAARRLDADQKGVHNMDTLGGGQEMATVTESGLYALIMTSRKPEARRFTRWVTDEVLPSIRKTGRYAAEGLIPVVLDRHERGMTLLRKVLDALVLAEDQCTSIGEEAGRMLALGGSMTRMMATLRREAGAEGGVGASNGGANEETRSLLVEMRDLLASRREDGKADASRDARMDALAKDLEAAWAEIASLRRERDEAVTGQIATIRKSAPVAGELAAALHDLADEKEARVRERRAAEEKSDAARPSLS